MAKIDAEREIRSRKRTTRCIEEQITISHAMWDARIDPNHDGIKANDLEEALSLDLDFKSRTSLSHLEEIDMVDEFIPPGPEILVIAEWMNEGEGKVVLGEVDEAAREGLNALAEELESSRTGTGAATATDGSGVTLRSVVAAEFDLIPDRVEEYLRTTKKPVEVLNRAVKAIEDADSVGISDQYGEIAFIHMPYRYRLSEKAVRLYRK